MAGFGFPASTVSIGGRRNPAMPIWNRLNTPAGGDVAGRSS